jgi:chromosome segregation ATPase
LCKQFEQKLLDLQTLRSAHQEALSIIQELQSQQAQTIEERQRAIEAKHSQVRALSAQLHDATAQIQQLRGQKDQVIANLRAELRQQQESFANRDKKQRNREEKLRDEIQASSKALARANQALEEQRILCDQMAQRAEESQRLPRGILQSSFAARFVQPFVVVLIDGDAYKVLYSQPHQFAGAREAVCSGLICGL